MGASLTYKDTDDDHGPLSGSFHETSKNSFLIEDRMKKELACSDMSQRPKDASKTTAFDRSNDYVYFATTKVVKAIMSLSQGVEKAASVQYLELVRHVGVELRALLSSVDELASIFPSNALKYVFVLNQYLSPD